MTQMGLGDIYRTFHPNTKEYTFFSVPHGAFSKIDHILGNKLNIDRYNKTGKIPYIFSDYHALKLKFNNNINCRKPIN